MGKRNRLSRSPKTLDPGSSIPGVVPHSFRKSNNSCPGSHDELLDQMNKERLKTLFEYNKHCCNILFPFMPNMFFQFYLPRNVY